MERLFEHLWSALSGRKNQTSAYALGRWLAERNAREPGKTFPVDRRELAEFTITLGLSEYTIRGAIKALAAIGFLDRRSPIWKHVYPVPATIYAVGADFAALVSKEKKPTPKGRTFKNEAPLLGQLAKALIGHVRPAPQVRSVAAPSRPKPSKDNPGLMAAIGRYAAARNQPRSASVGPWRNPPAVERPESDPGLEASIARWRALIAPGAG